MNILIAVLVTLYGCIAGAILVLDDMLSPLGALWGAKRTPGWKRLLTALGWPIIGILHLIRGIALKVVNFLKWLK